MFKRIRIAVLLYILAFVAVGNFLASARSTDWVETLWVDVYPINGDGSDRAQSFIDDLETSDLDAMEAFLAREARRHGIDLDEPFRIELANQVSAPMPQLENNPSFLGTLMWSLRMRWFAVRVRSASERPAPDIQLFAIYHDGSQAASLDRSTALERGLIAVANVFASRSSRGSNQVVMVHELLHTLGASDKYDRGTNFPLFPAGYADREAHPLHPQTRAELMGGRIPVDGHSAEIPSSLRQVVIGPETALEIGWTAPP